MLAVVPGRPALIAKPFEAVEEQVERELELELLVAAGADRRQVAAGRGQGDLDDVRVPPRHLVERRRRRVRVAAAPPSSKSSRVKPHMRLPRACMTWWVRSAEKPPARNIPDMESMYPSTTAVRLVRVSITRDAHG